MASQTRLDELVSTILYRREGQNAKDISYAGSIEILGYFKDIVTAHNLACFAKLSHRVVGAWWDEELGEWKIKVQPGEDADAAFYDRGDILINASGVLKYVGL
jgi:cation diffusion facilitator CzcD-associated flavoprotein CzcO